MYEDGLIYRGDRIVNWCPRCHSTLADDEVEYKPQKAKMYTFKYSHDFPMAISTTRPETKLGDTAVAVNPKDKRYKKYIGKIFQVNFVGVPLKIKIIADRGVEMNFGTGALGVTPAHSAADWQMAEKNNLQIVKVIDENGNIHSGFEKYSGKSSLEAREMIVKELQKANLLEKEEEFENNLSLCYRCETAIEPLPSLQWFIDVNKKITRYKKTIKELSLEAVRKGVFGRKKIKIVPERFERNYFNWMDNLRDWCISRQIWFGHRIPVWYKDDETYVGIEAPKGKNWKQDEDTLDTWFSSGLWTFSTLAQNPDQIEIKNGKLNIKSDDFKNYHPTSVLETGYDILFFWVARMILMTTYAVGDIPFQDVYLHGLVRDDKGRKMSKSLGNSIDPLDSCQKFGTDATRLSLVIGSTPGNDTNLSEEKIISYRNFVTKLWNISKFIITNIKFKENKIDYARCNLADKWILSKINTLVSGVTDDLEKYRFSLAGEKLREFTWNEFADWYLEISKIKQNAGVLGYVLQRILSLWHPFIPFVTEKIYEYIKNKDGNFLMVEGWPISDKKMIDKKSEKEFEKVMALISKIRNTRSVYHIEPVKILNVYADKIKKKEIIEKLARVKFEKEKIAKKKLLEISVSGFSLKLDIAEIIDVQKELSIIKKEIKNLKDLIDKNESLLKNKNFIKSAPREIVEANKQRLEEYKEKIKIQKELQTNLKKIG
jgi:valyl-tRNA synthetase